MNLNIDKVYIKEENLYNSFMSEYYINSELTLTENDIENLCITIATILKKYIVQNKKNIIDNFKRKESELDSIYKAFDHISKDKQFENDQIINQEINLGLKLFSDYFFSLDLNKNTLITLYNSILIFISKEKSYPGNLSESEWILILEKILAAFYFIKENNSLVKLKQNKKLYEEILLGLSLFSENFLYLWI